MSDLAKREENGKKGESRTESILLDRFWVYKRSVDIEGADFLIQTPVDDYRELLERKKTVQVFGVVQAKYFEEKNQVKILKKYVEDDQGKPFPEFFAFLHTNDSDGEDVCYFFASSEIKENFTLKSIDNDLYYCFGLTDSRTYDVFHNLKKRDILNRIELTMQKTEEERNKALVKIFYETTSVTHTRITDETKTTETGSKIIVTEQKGSYAEISEINKATGVKSIVGKSLGNIHKIKYNPITGSTSNDFDDL